MSTASDLGRRILGAGTGELQVKLSHPGLGRCDVLLGVASAGLFQLQLAGGEGVGMCLLQYSIAPVSLLYPHPQQSQSSLSHARRSSSGWSAKVRS